VTDRSDDPDPPADRTRPHTRDDVDDVPTVTCSRCDAEWDLSYELDDLGVGNRAFEQFALDHVRHTGHFPDEVTPWVASCRRCPGGDRFLSETPARRWAATHARHTRHDVAVTHADTEVTVTPPK
jgi:hypothetical protein